MSTKQIDGYKIRMNEVLGRGSFGDVFVGVSDETQAKVAIKVLKKANSMRYIIQSTQTSTSRTRSSTKSKSCKQCGQKTSSASST